MKFTPLLCGALLFSAALSTPLHAQEMTPQNVQNWLKTPPQGEAAKLLAENLRQWFGAENLKKGPNPKLSQLDVAWAIEAPEAKTVAVVSNTSDWRLPLQKIGDTNVWAAATTLEDGTGLGWNYVVDGQKIGGNFFDVYRTPPEATEQGAPKGKTTQMPDWKSTIFPNTTRNWWVYVPSQYTPDKPACVMVFQDGGGTKSWVPTVFDNMIAKGEMPVTVGIFIDPGVGPNNRSNRSFEYDTLSDQYARFLLEEILPEVEKTTKLKHDAPSRAICGASSGGICAFTVAWQRPNEFSKVVSWIGSFTNIANGESKREGGHNYEALIRKTDPKPIRVFLQDGANDLDNANGNWPLANQQMAKALAFAKYDYKFVFGQGNHSANHGRAIFPDTLRWLWRDYAKN